MPHPCSKSTAPPSKAPPTPSPRAATGLPSRDAEPQALWRGGWTRASAPSRRIWRAVRAQGAGPDGLAWRRELALWRGARCALSGVRPETLIAAGLEAMKGWRAVGADGRTGICPEILQRSEQAELRDRPRGHDDHRPGLDDGLPGRRPARPGSRPEAVTYAWREQSFVPAETTWEPPQGKNPALVMEEALPDRRPRRGLVIGAAPSRPGNTYPACSPRSPPATRSSSRRTAMPSCRRRSPCARSHRARRERHRPQPASLCVATQRSVTQALATHPAVQSVDFTGSNAFGQWLIDNCRQAQVYAELAGVNKHRHRLDGLYKAMLGSLAFTARCIPARYFHLAGDSCRGRDRHRGRPQSYDRVCADLARAVERCPPTRVAHAVLGAIQSADTAEASTSPTAARWAGRAHGLAASLDNPSSRRRCAPRLLCLRRRRREGLRKSASARSASSSGRRRHRRGSAALRACGQDPRRAPRSTSTHEAGRHRRDDRSHLARQGRAVDQPHRRRVSGNQSAASPITTAPAANPSANASYSVPAFVANRFRVVQRRYHV